MGGETSGGADLRARAEAWVEGDPDPSTRAEILALIDKGDTGELAARFDASVEFGTAGLRALLGGGPARMNRAVIIRACHGLAQHLAATVPDGRERGVVIGYDARHMSRAFADDAAGVLAASGFRVHRFAEPEPTPLVAFAVGHLAAAAGVMITASHNAAAYNGLKVYGPNAAQVVPPSDSEIARAMSGAPPANAVPRDADSASILEIGTEIEVAYVRALCAMLEAPKAPSPLTIAYTPLHGVGHRLAQRAFAAAGFAPLIAVKEQVEPDPDFPSAPFPNPEEPGALDLALALAQRTRADLVVAHDPDADRLAVAVPKGEGFVQLSGNQLGVLLGHHWLTSRAGGDRAVLSTIVSSPMLGAIARDAGLHYEETLTGFKWIADRALALAREGKRFAFGYEEALGYAVGDLVRDKDGISAAVLFAELTDQCRARGISVLDYLELLYRQFGFYASAQRTIGLPSATGAARALMDRLRRAPLARIGGRAVLARRDYALPQGALPPSDVLAYELDGETRVIVRPSGTEPKLKCYIDHREPLAPDDALADAEERARREMARIGDDLVDLFRR